MNPLHSPGNDERRPLISVVVATYQAGALIEACVRSVLRQSEGDFEICVVDGQSRDDTVARLRALASEDARVRWMSEPDGGVYDAMNKGVAMSRGRWIFFLGADDRLAHEKVFLELRGALDAGDADFVHGNIIWRNDGWGRDGQIYGGELSVEEILEKNFCHQAIFYARGTFERFGGYRTKYRVLADWEFNLRIFRHVRRRHVGVMVAEVSGGGLSQRAFDYAFDRDFMRLACAALGLRRKSEAFRARNNRLRQTVKDHFRARRFKLGWRYLGLWLADENFLVVGGSALRRIGAKPAALIRRVFGGGASRRPASPRV